MSPSHATKNVFLAPFQEPSGVNMVTQSMARINHTYFWWRSKTDCREAQRLDSEYCWLHWTCSCRHASARCPFPYFWTACFQLPCSCVQLWQAWQAPEKLFHSIASHFSPPLEASLTCTWLGMAHWLPSSSASCRCPHPRTPALAQQQLLHPHFAQPGPVLHRRTEPVGKVVC